MLVVNTPAASKNLTLLATVKTELGISGTSEDAVLTAFIAQASDAIGQACRRPEGFGVETVTQTFRPARARDKLALFRDIRPSITSITEDGTALTASDWELDGSILYRLSEDQRVCWRAKKIVVVYSAGYTLPGAVTVTLPDALQRVAIDMVTKLYHAEGRDPSIRSEKTFDVLSVSYMDSDRVSGSGLPVDVQQRLTPFMRWNWYD